MKKKEKKMREKQGGQQWRGRSKENMGRKEKHLKRGKGRKEKKIKRREEEKKLRNKKRR